MQTTLINEIETKTVTQSILGEYRSKARLVKELEQRLKDIEKEVEKEIRSGATVEFGPHNAEIKTFKGRRSVPWKSVVIRELGDGYATRVMASTKPSPDYEKLVIS